MCIIAIKPSGAKLPDEQTIKTMFERNPHGAGFMYPYKGRVEIRKGFMTYDGFIQALRNVHNHIGDGAPIVMHFRITTHGGTCPENTHPFPLTNDIAEMKKLYCSAKIGIAHNGIINIKPRDNTVSDTQEYIASVMYPVYRHNKRFYKTQRILNGIRDTINGSRMAILTGEGKVYRIGNWVEKDGCFYSNDSFKERDTRWAYTYSYTPKTAPWEDEPKKAATKPSYASRYSPMYALIMPLDEDTTYRDSDGFLWDGYCLGIDRLGRLYELDPEAGVAYESHTYVKDDVEFDRDTAVYFEVA